MQQALHVKAERAFHVHQTRVDQIARAHARTHTHAREVAQRTRVR
jgi:hypothetical protein